MPIGYFLVDISDDYNLRFSRWLCLSSEPGQPLQVQALRDLDWSFLAPYGPTHRIHQLYQYESVYPLSLTKVMSEFKINRDNPSFTLLAEFRLKFPLTPNISSKLKVKGKSLSTNQASLTYSVDHLKDTNQNLITLPRINL